MEGADAVAAAAAFGCFLSSDAPLAVASLLSPAVAAVDLRWFEARPAAAAAPSVKEPPVLLSFDMARERKEGLQQRVLVWGSRSCRQEAPGREPLQGKVGR